MRLNKKALMLSAAALSVLIGGAGAYVYHKTYFGKSLQLSLKDFEQGTRVSYKILTKQGAVATGEEVIGNAPLTLPVSNEYAQNGVVDYHLSIEPPEGEAEMLDLLLSVNKSNGNVDFKGEGFDAFSSMQVTSGQRQADLDADWSGIIDSDMKNIMGDDFNPGPMIEMAFQNIGIESDYNALSGGKVEVFFGEDLDHSQAGIRARFGRAVNAMGTQLSAIMVQQTFIVGKFFDASIQLRTQRKIQELHARAHKDYHPSDQMCRFGTFMRSVARTERKADLEKFALNKFLMNKYLGLENTSAGGGPTTDTMAIIKRYTGMHCDPRDNGGAAAGMCEDVPDTPEDRELLNKDVDYTRTLANKMTLDINFADGFLAATTNNLSNDEQNILAMARHLYLPRVTESPEEKEMESMGLLPHYDSRAYAAKMNVAHTSFVNLVGMKSSAPEGNPTTTTQTAPPPAPFGTNVPIEASNYSGSPPTTLPVSAPANTRTAPITSTPPSHTATPLTAPSPAGSWRVLNEDSGWAYMKALLVEMGVVDKNGDGNVHDEIDTLLGERPSYYAQMEVLTKKIYQSPNFFTNLYDKPANVARIGASIDAITLMNQRDRYESLLRQEMLTSVILEEELQSHVEDVNTQIYRIIQKDQIRN